MHGVGESKFRPRETSRKWPHNHDNDKPAILKNQPLTRGVVPGLLPHDLGPPPVHGCVMSWSRPLEYLASSHRRLLVYLPPDATTGAAHVPAVYKRTQANFQQLKPPRAEQHISQLREEA